MFVTNIKQSLLNTFNRMNKPDRSITLDDVDWSGNNVWLQGDCNSRIVITAKSTSLNFKGTQTLYYVRRDISQDLAGVLIPGKPTDYARVNDVLTVLRERMGIPVQDGEYTNSALVAGATTLKLSPNTSSMAYLPTTTVTLSFESV